MEKKIAYLFMAAESTLLRAARKAQSVGGSAVSGLEVPSSAARWATGGRLEPGGGGEGFGPPYPQGLVAATVLQIESPPVRP